MKTPLLLLAFVITTACGKPSPYVLKPVESEPVVVGGIEFSVVTQAEWQLPGRSMEMPVVLQLRLKNVTKKPILFPTFDTFDPRLSDASGKPVSLSGGRDATRITPRILLQPEAAYSYELIAKLQRAKDGKGHDLIYQDHTGTWLTAKVSTGDYSLSFDVFPTHNADLQKGLPGAPLWSAKGNTKAVKFQIVPGP